MTMDSTFQKLVLLLILVFCCMFCNTNAQSLKICKLDKIYQLGDSISDVGNFIREFPIGTASPIGRRPYGQTINKATGRCSDGLLIVDYIAMAAGLPLLPPYKKLDANFTNGVNFAVAGATALSSTMLATKHITNPLTISSLNVQLGWMSHHFNSICHDARDCAEKLHNALFLVGEIGGNEYNYGFLEGRTMKELRMLVLDVVAAIIDAARKIINLGAKRLVIPGNFPIGCLPIYKTAFQVNRSAAYDENQCLKQFNNFSMYHNDQLQQAIDKLKLDRPNPIIVYGDYYNAYQFFLQFAKSNEFETERACCGTGGEYNFMLTRFCGTASVSACPDPQRYMSWDGVHFTQEGHKIMTGWLLNNIINKLQCPF